MIISQGQGDVNGNHKSTTRTNRPNSSRLTIVCPGSETLRGVSQPFSVMVDRSRYLFIFLQIAEMIYEKW